MSKRQKEETAKYCLNISQLSVGSLIFNAFNQNSPIITITFSLSGLILAAASYILAMWIFKEIK